MCEELKSHADVGIMSQIVEGKIVNYRLGPKTQKPKECIIKFKHVSSAYEANRLVGRKIAWIGREAKVVGKIVALHGRNGLVRVRFRKGVPGQALGTAVQLVG